MVRACRVQWHTIVHGMLYNIAVFRPQTHSSAVQKYRIFREIKSGRESLERMAHHCTQHSSLSSLVES